MFEPLRALFKSSEPEIKIIDKVWMSAHAKLNACAAMATTDENCVFITWFEETHNTLTRLLGDEKVFPAQKVEAHALQDKLVIFVEHHPLSKKELALFKILNLKEAPVLSSLEEPLFMWFGGEKTIELMKKLGMKEDEVIGSSLITKSIRNAQNKIEKQVMVEREARSQQEWLTLNLPSK